MPSASSKKQQQGEEEENFMMSMYCNCTYTNFSLTDVGKFERRMTKWCTEECMQGKSMLIFDKPSLVVGGAPTIEKIDGKIIYKVELPNITLSFISITETMCIMYKIWENKTQSVLYNMPLRWNGIELWLCD